MLFVQPTQAGSKLALTKQDEFVLNDLRQQLHEQKLKQLKQQQQDPEDGVSDDEVPEEEEPQTKADEYFILADAFLQGFRANQVFPSAMNCTKYLHSSVEVFNETRKDWKNETHPAYDNRTEQVFDTAWWISYSLAPMSSYCFLSNLEVIAFVQLKNEQFGGLSGYFPAWMQNTLGNVITVNLVLGKIEDAKEVNDTVACYYWYGRLANIMFVFDPQEEETFEEEDIPEFDGFEQLYRLPQVRKLRQGFKQWLQIDFDNDEFNTENNNTVPYNDTSITDPSQIPSLGYTGIPWYFFRGYFEYAFVQSSPNATICDGNISIAANRTQEIKKDITNTTNETMSQNAVEFQELLETAYPITFNCYCARTEIKYSWSEYAKDLVDPSRIVFNTIHKTASLYDAFYYLRQQWAIDRSTLTTQVDLKNYWYKMGGYCGLITRIFLTPPPSASEAAEEGWPPQQPYLDTETYDPQSEIRPTSDFE